MAKSLRVVIIGGVAAGPKVASKIIRLNPQAEVTVIEKKELFSYAGCGLPYYVSGVVHSKQELMSTPAGVVRDSVFFQNVKNVHVRTKTEAVEIDRKKKQVKIRDLKTYVEELVPYDKLVLATGAIPVIPRIPGVDKQGVFTLHGMHDAEGIKAKLAEGKAKDVVIIGGGLIGVEMTEALVACGCRVTLIEMLPQILGILDWEMAHTWFSSTWNPKA
ncbi:MAG: FAD/NAD(P)-binding oxidoreductase [Desulfomonilia bacterium]